MNTIKILKKDDLANQPHTARKEDASVPASFDKVKVAQTVQSWVVGWRSQKQAEALRARAIYTPRI